MRALFITGTDTGVGKTWITGLLGRYFLEKGLSVVTQKWIQTGGHGLNEDIAAHHHIMGKTHQDYTHFLENLCPYSFRYPASPHLAASLENRAIKKEKIFDHFHRLIQHFDFVIVEGSGGLLVPYDQNQTCCDLIQELEIPLLVVSANRLGSINQTLLTLEAINTRKLICHGIIMNETQKEESLITQDNIKTIQRLASVDILAHCPFSSNPSYETLSQQIGSAVENKLFSNSRS